MPCHFLRPGEQHFRHADGSIVRRWFGRLIGRPGRNQLAILLVRRVGSVPTEAVAAAVDDHACVVATIAGIAKRGRACQSWRFTPLLEIPNISGFGVSHRHNSGRDAIAAVGKT